MLDPSKQPGLDVDQSSVDPANAPTDQERLANGPLYLSADLVMRAAQKLSLVEWFKLVGWSIRRAEKQDDRRRIANWAIDVFVIAKWALVVIAWISAIANWVVVTLIVYLLVWNSLTYFYYHLWIVEDPKQRASSSHRERRRFVSLVLAVAYSMVTYAYLYQRVLPGGFEWPESVSRCTSALAFSIGNALTSQAGGLKPVTDGAYLLTASQLVFTFGFVAMLLSSSVPRVRPS